MPRSINALKPLIFLKAKSQLAKSNTALQPCIQTKENLKMCPITKQERASQTQRAYIQKQNVCMKTVNSSNQTPKYICCFYF